MNTKFPGVFLMAAWLTASLGACTKLDHAAATTSSGVPGASAKVFVDPITGEMREPTAAEMTTAVASSQLATTDSGKALKASAPFEEVQLPDGVTMVRFGKQVEEKVCISATGEVTSKCPVANAAPQSKVGAR